MRPDAAHKLGMTNTTQSTVARRRTRTANGEFAPEAEKPGTRSPATVSLETPHDLRDLSGLNGAEALRAARASRRAQVERLLNDGLPAGMKAWVAPGYTRAGALKWSIKDDATMTLREGIVEKTDSSKAVEELLPIDVLIVSREALARRERLAAHRAAKSQTDRARVQ
ncbi:hypothetical protein [Gryllotalpicola protaetiae]|uniref:Uncharacterized protein n=1 Tax=Gryllotalpicola protaetiae TaxID=2419771 RepID=A0A387BHB5_9MICO|nr:hypothetical protein [Gryllotalpicola protaetiae]AYG03415.1 hypothetical protein D7I44_07620 [Gryllotalpicola protaetiae]